MRTDDEKFTRIDRMRYTKNTLSSTLVYIAILFDVIYFINIYGSDVKYDVGTYYYQARMGISIVYNLLFMLAAFLSSEGVKNYHVPYHYFLILVGAGQFIRIFLLPLRAFRATVVSEGALANTHIMSEDQFKLVSAYLVISGACCIIASVIGLIKCAELKAHEANLVKEQANG